MICKLCAEGCIPHEKMMTEEHEIDTELQHISDQIARLQDLADDSEEKIESMYNSVNTMPPEMLAERFLDHAVTDGNTITFSLSGGLHFIERLV